MATVRTQIEEIQKLQTTINILNGLIDKISPSSLVLTGGCGGYDEDVISTIREFLIIQRDALLQQIACIYDLGVSGSCS